MLRLALAVVSAVVLGACSPSGTHDVGEPIVAGTDTPDQDLAEHLDALIRSVRTTPDSALMRGRLGMAYDVNRMRDAAQATYRQAEVLDPEDFRWPYFRAHLIAETAEHAVALEVLDKALAIDPEYAPAWLWRGSWLLKAGNPDDAMDAFSRAKELDGAVEAQFGYAQAMVALGRHDEAAEVLESLVNTFPRPFVYRTLGEALRALGRIEEARVAMVQGAGAQPVVWADERRGQRTVHLRGNASYELAKSLSAAGRLDDAVAILDRLQRHHPEAHCAREEGFFLACNLMNSFSIAEDRAGNPEQAFQTIRRGLDLNPNFIPFHLTMANLHRQQRDLDSALGHVDRALELNPSRGYAHEQRGRLLFGMARYEEARTALQTALEYEPEKQTTLFYLGLVEVEEENWSAAVDKFERAIRVEPRFALGHVFLARSLAESGRLDEARQAQKLAREYGAAAPELRETERRLREIEARLPADSG